MAQELSFRCPLAGGLHARPASHLVALAAELPCAVRLVNERDGGEADARSLVELVALDVREGDPCRLCCEGPDELRARDALERFVRDVLPGCDVPLERPAAVAAGELPRALRGVGTRVLCGTPASAGIGMGRVVPAGGAAPWSGLLAAGEPAPAAPGERELARAALHAVREARAARAAARRGRPEAEMLEAGLALARDAALAAAVEAELERGRGAARAVAQACERLAARLERSSSALARERVADVEELARELLERLPGGLPPRPPLVLDGPSVLVAESLGPRELLELERGLLRGLVLERAGRTAHALVLARSFGLPALVGVHGARAALRAGAEVVVDAERGLLLAADEPRARRFYARQIAVRAARAERLARETALEDGPARTRDGVRLELAANAAGAEEVEHAFAQGAEAIGLLRTEMLFLGRAEAPAEEEQHAELARAARAARGRALIVRAFDVGGDKALPWLATPPEPNPALGRRGVRVYPDEPELLDAHLRALLRASAAGGVRLMLPMVATAAEVRWVRERLARQQEALRAAGVPFDAALPVGIMLELPAAAFALDELCAAADFVSLGTNDLLQYFAGADRENPRVAALQDPRQPAFLRLLAQVVEGVRARGRWIGLCGEMAGDVRLLPLLVGLGLDEISAAPPALPALRRALARLDAAACRALLARALACADAEQVGALLAEHAAAAAAAAAPALAPELVLLDSSAATKAEAIGELVDLLHAGLRTDDPHAVERAVWAREEAYSTGVGGGFAVPHCKSDALLCTSLAVVRLARPVDWDAQDGQPVSCAILLAVRASGDAREHMRRFSTLARRLVDEAFRARVLAAPDAASLLSVLEGVSAPAVPATSPSPERADEPAS